MPRKSRREFEAMADRFWAERELADLERRLTAIADKAPDHSQPARFATDGIVAMSACRKELSLKHPHAAVRAAMRAATAAANAEFAENFAREWLAGRRSARARGDPSVSGKGRKGARNKKTLEMDRLVSRALSVKQVTALAGKPVSKRIEAIKRKLPSLSESQIRRALARRAKADNLPPA